MVVTKTDTERMTAEIDLMTNATYIVKDGVISLVSNPPTGFGEQLIIWQDGKPSIGKISFTERL